MPFNVNEFRGSFSDSEPFKPSAYEVQFAALPNKLGISDARFLNYRCLNASLPAKSVGTTELKTYGPIRKLAYGGIHDDITLTFILSDDLKEREVFYKWLDLISSDITGNAEYYDEYVVSFTITTFNKNGKPNSVATILEAFPKSMGEVQLSWDENDSVSTLEVTFAYRFFEEERKGEPVRGAINLITDLF